ncbi:MAG: sulfatase [Phycisphaerae bacterium]|nr:sulfatase [Phycisphaerae bacterium]
MRYSLNGWLTVAFALGAAVGTHAASGATPDRPHVLLIVSEDTGTHLGCYGDKTVPTPNLDRLAADGVRFSHAYVTTASCSESRSSLLTGLYPHQNGQIGLATHRFRMFRAWPNIPSLLKRAGYRTGILGKIHVNPESAFPFDLNWRDGKSCSYDHRDVRKMAEVAGEFMRASDEPFFLMVNYPDTHLPFLTQQNGIPEHPLTADDVTMWPGVGVDTSRARQSLADYYNCVARLDTGVGMLLDELRRSGCAENTLIIFLGDHGVQFPRGKLTCYEGGVRVPMLIRWPGKPAGLIRQELVSTVDILPTILEATATPNIDNLPGRSLAPLCKPGPVEWREYLCTEYHAHVASVYYPQRTVRDGRYKLIVSLLPDRADRTHDVYLSPDIWWTTLIAADVAKASEPIQRAFALWARPGAERLFDLQDDPDELNNLAGRPEYADVQQRLRDHLRQWQQQTRDPLLDADRLARLTAEMDAFRDSGREDAWQYPEYLDVQADAGPTSSAVRNPK